MKVINSYNVKIMNHKKVLRETLKVYQEALSFVIDVVNENFEDVDNLQGKFKNGYIEKLIHSTSSNSAKYKAFDKKFYKFPSYLRRNLISEAIGIVSSYQTNLYKYISNKKVGKKPKLNRKPNKMPTFYKKEMYKLLDNETICLKVFHKNDWVWYTFN